MAMFEDIFRSMERRLKHESDRIKAVRAEMDALAKSYNTYADLARTLKECEDRTKRIQAILLPSGMTSPRLGHDSDVVGDRNEVWPSPESLRSKLTIWQVLSEYLAHVPEASIEEFQTFCEALGISGVTRQATESALRTHPKLFRVTKRGGEKYLSRCSDGSVINQSAENRGVNMKKIYLEAPTCDCGHLVCAHSETGGCGGGSPFECICKARRSEIVPRKFRRDTRGRIQRVANDPAQAEVEQLEKLI